MSTGVGNWLNENTPGFNDRPAPENNRLIADGTDYRGEYFQETLAPFSKIGLSKDEKGVPEVLGGTIAGEAWESVANLRSGDIVGAVFGAASVGLGAQELFTDPFGFVGSQIAGWMLEHLEVYRKTLDALAGNPDMVKAYSETWNAIAGELVTVSNNWKDGLAKDIVTWAGDSGDAYRAKAVALIDRVAAAGGVAAGMSETMQKTSEIVKVVRDTVVGILASLIGALIAYTIELACTAGAATPAVIAQVYGRFARDGFKIATLLTQMAQAFKDLSGLAKGLSEVVAILLTPPEEGQPAPA